MRRIMYASAFFAGAAGTWIYMEVTMRRATKTIGWKSIKR